eukprot:1734855-Pyramimonas_sp.AAC.1
MLPCDIGGMSDLDEEDCEDMRATPITAVSQPPGFPTRADGLQPPRETNRLVHPAAAPVSLGPPMGPPTDPPRSILDEAQSVFQAFGLL